MKPRITLLTIGVNDLEKSLAFYRGLRARAAQRRILNPPYFFRRRVMAAIPSPTKPVARSTNEAGSGTTGPSPPILALAFAVAGNSSPSAIQYTYTDFISPGYFFRRRVMATIPSPTKPVARSTNEAGSGVRR